MRRTWKTTLVIGAVLSAMLVGGALAGEDAGDGLGHGRRFGRLRKFAEGGMGHFRKMLEELDLSSEQKVRIAAIIKTCKPEGLKLLNEGKEKRRKMVDLALEGAGEGAIRRAANDLGKTIGDGAVLRSKVHKEIYDVLTPEQRETADKFREKHRARVDKFLDEAGNE